MQRRKCMCSHCSAVASTRSNRIWVMQWKESLLWKYECCCTWYLQQRSRVLRCSKLPWWLCLSSLEVFRRQRIIYFVEKQLLQILGRCPNTNIYTGLSQGNQQRKMGNQMQVIWMRNLAWSKYGRCTW